MFLLLTTKTDGKSPILLITPGNNLMDLCPAIFLCLDPNISMDEYRKKLEDFAELDKENINFSINLEGIK